MKWGRVALCAALLCAVVGTASAQGNKAAGGSSQIARGKYLVENVGMCADCHSPRNQNGEFVKEQWLGGSPLFFKPTVPIPNWMEVAPAIAGLPGWSEKDAITLLSTGKSLNGRVLNPPMPPVRFSQADATAVVAYLKSLKPNGSPAAKPAAKESKPAAKAAKKSTGM